MDLRDEQSGWAGHCDPAPPPVVSGKRRDLPRLVVDECRFEPARLPGGAIAVLAEPRTSPATPADRLWHEQVDHHTLVPEPDSRLLEIQDESARPHRLLQFWRVVQLGGIERDVTVARVRRDRQVTLAGVEVDRLRADEHQRVALVAERVKRVEQHAARLDVDRIRHARHPRYPAST